MKKLIVFGAGSAVAVAAAGAALFGAGSAAAAPDVVGMLYEDAVSEIQAGGGTARIAVTVGDRQDAMGDCLVTGATDASFLRIAESASGEVLLTLNCNRGVAGPSVPGASAASPAGKEFTAIAEQKQAEQEAANQEEAELAAPVTPDE